MASFVRFATYGLWLRVACATIYNPYDVHLRNPSCSCWVTEYYDASQSGCYMTQVCPWTSTSTETVISTTTSTTTTTTPARQLKAYRYTYPSPVEQIMGLPSDAAPIGVGYWKPKGRSLLYTPKKLGSGSIVGLAGTEDATGFLPQYAVTGDALYFKINGDAYSSYDGGQAVKRTLVPSGSEPIGAGIWLAPDQTLYNEKTGLIPGVSGITQARAYWWQIEDDASSLQVRINLAIGNNYFAASSPGYTLNQIQSISAGSTILNYGIFQAADGTLSSLSNLALQPRVHSNTVGSDSVTAPIEAYPSSNIVVGKLFEVRVGFKKAGVTYAFSTFAPEPVRTAPAVDTGGELRVVGGQYITQSKDGRIWLHSGVTEPFGHSYGAEHPVHRGINSWEWLAP